ncbi:hypothetical protein BM613_10060 [Sulfoacidibacillus thermotolerans]|uniref:Uncharacterized protein n=1 Tax=Sulfoacidibacillus thermotolerans TaxID=1765684 RepID=A0A2U3D7E0_SULT2|nr:hypothetical protein BM613_10060 [Sulfoacidibacillus thermotolerans]
MKKKGSQSEGCTEQNVTDAPVNARRVVSTKGRIATICCVDIMRVVPRESHVPFEDEGLLLF